MRVGCQDEPAEEIYRLWVEWQMEGAVEPEPEPEAPPPYMLSGVELQHLALMEMPAVMLAVPEPEQVGAGVGGAAAAEAAGRARALPSPPCSPVVPGADGARFRPGPGR